MARLAALLAVACGWSSAAGPVEVPALPPVAAEQAGRAPAVPGSPVDAAPAPADVVSAAPATPPAAESAAIVRRVDEARAAWGDEALVEALPEASSAPSEPLASPAAAVEAPRPQPLLSRRGAVGLTLMVASHAHYIAIPWILHLTIPLWGRVAASATAYAVSWALFAAGAYLGGQAVWLRLKRRFRPR